MSEITHDMADLARQKMTDTQSTGAHNVLREYIAQQRRESGVYLPAESVEKIRAALMLAQRDNVDQSGVHRACGAALALMPTPQPPTAAPASEETR